MVAGVDPGLVRGVVLLRDVDVRGGVVSDEDGREADRLAERGHVLGDLLPHLQGKRLAVDELPRHGS